MENINLLILHKLKRKLSPAGPASTEKYVEKNQQQQKTRTNKVNQTCKNIILNNAICYYFYKTLFCLFRMMYGSNTPLSHAHLGVTFVLWKLDQEFNSTDYWDTYTNEEMQPHRSFNPSPHNWHHWREREQNEDKNVRTNICFLQPIKSDLI